MAEQIEPRWPEGVEHSVKPTDVLWEMDWSGLNEHGERLYPDKPEREEKCHEEVALAMLLINEVVFLNSHWGEETWPEDARRTASLNVDTSDVFAWGCADAERIGFAEIEAVYRHWLRDPAWGTAVWAMLRHREMPQRPVEKRIRDAGVWDLDALRAEHGLRANHYDGINGVVAAHKREAYAAWCAAEGRDPLAFDGGWWEGWKDYVAAHPDWHSAEWKAEEKRRIAAWKLENGYA